jgi:hypothetical protein
MPATSHDEIVSKLKRTLSRSKNRKVYISISIALDFNGDIFTTHNFHTIGHKATTTTVVGYVTSFSECVSIATTIAKHSQNKGWLDTFLYFNGIKHTFDDVQRSQELSISINYDADDANEISERMMGEGVRNIMLKNVRFVKLKNTPYRDSLEFMQHKLCSVINTFSSQSETDDPVEAISNFINANKPDPSSVKGRAIISLATSIAQTYYESDAAVEWLLSHFNESVIFTSSIEDEMSPIIKAFEHELSDFTLTPIARYPAKWFMFSKDNDVVFRLDKDNSILPITKRYVDYYMTNISKVLEFDDLDPEILINEMKDMTTYPKNKLVSSDAPFIFKNFTNCPLITYLLTNYTNTKNGIPNLHEMLINSARVDARINTKEGTNPDSDDIINDVRKAIVAVSMPSNSPALHFNPLRIALLQLSSNKDLEHCMAIQMLKGIPKEDVAKKLLYQSDIKPFLEHYNVSPMNLIEMTNNEKIKGHAFELMTDN